MNYINTITNLLGKHEQLNMIVTNLEIQRRNPNRLNLYLDNVFCCGVSLNIVAKYKLFNEKPIDGETVDMILFDTLYERVLDRVVQYLSSYRKTERQAKDYIKQLLYKKKGDWFSKDLLLDEDKIISKIMKFIKENGLVNDKIYAKEFINGRITNKPRSLYLIRSELIGKGIDQEIVDEVLSNDNTNELNDEQLIVNLCRKKYGTDKIDKEDRKKIAFFQRKGFSWDVISCILSDD